jgi:hypothetical protein
MFITISKQKTKIRMTLRECYPQIGLSIKRGTGGRHPSSRVTPLCDLNFQQKSDGPRSCPHKNLSDDRLVYDRDLTQDDLDVIALSALA